MDGSDEFVPDSDLVSEVRPSPNRNARRANRRPDLLLLHYTGMDSAEAALTRLCQPASEVSAHYVIREDGRIVQLVPERERAWHAGAGRWAGETDINSCSIGIEIVNGGHERGCPAYPAVQIDAVIRLSRDIVDRWAIAARRVLAHSDIAPDRKEDPGEHFPWAELHANGIGHWITPPHDDQTPSADEARRPSPLPGGPSRSEASVRGGNRAGGTSGDPSERPSTPPRKGEEGSTSASVGPEAEGGAAQVQAMLARYGYALAPTGVFDAATASVLTAFQRHFRPERVDGIADASTLATLASLLAALPSTETSSQRGAGAAPAKIPDAM